MDGRKIPSLYVIVKKKIEENSVDGTLSYRDFNRIMSWAIHLTKHDSKILRNELNNMKIIKLGNRGLKITIREDCAFRNNRGR